MSEFNEAEIKFRMNKFNISREEAVKQIEDFKKKMAEYRKGNNVESKVLGTGNSSKAGFYIAYGNGTAKRFPLNEKAQANAFAKKIGGKVKLEESSKTPEASKNLKKVLKLSAKDKTTLASINEKLTNTYKRATELSGNLSKYSVNPIQRFVNTYVGTDKFFAKLIITLTNSEGTWKTYIWLKFGLDEDSQGLHYLTIRKSLLSDVPEAWRNGGFKGELPFENQYALTDEQLETIAEYYIDGNDRDLGTFIIQDIMKKSNFDFMDSYIKSGIYKNTPKLTKDFERIVPKQAESSSVLETSLDTSLDTNLETSLETALDDNEIETSTKIYSKEDIEKMLEEHYSHISPASYYDVYFDAGDKVFKVETNRPFSSNTSKESLQKKQETLLKRMQKLATSFLENAPITFTSSTEVVPDFNATEGNLLLGITAFKLGKTEISTEELDYHLDEDASTGGIRGYIIPKLNIIISGTSYLEGGLSGEDKDEFAILNMEYEPIKGSKDYYLNFKGLEADFKKLTGYSLPESLKVQLTNDLAEFENSSLEASAKKDPVADAKSVLAQFIKQEGLGSVSNLVADYYSMEEFQDDYMDKITPFIDKIVGLDDNEDSLDEDYYYDILDNVWDTCREEGHFEDNE